MKTNNRRRKANSRKAMSRNALQKREWPRPSIRNMEVYAFDVVNTMTTGTSWVVQNGLIAVPSTAGVQDRQGLRISPVALEINFFVRGKTTGSYSANTPDHGVRIVVFQSRYAAPVGTDVFAYSANILSPYNLAHVGQSREDANIMILDDRVVPVAPLYKLSHYYNVTIDASTLLVKAMRFADYTASDPINGSIYIAYITDCTSGGVTVPTVSYVSHLLYTDA